MPVRAALARWEQEFFVEFSYYHNNPSVVYFLKRQKADLFNDNKPAFIQPFELQFY